MCWLAVVAAAAPAGAQSNPRYVQFQPPAVKGALYVPDSGPAPHVGILALHRTSNYLGYHGCRELSRRGYMVLCMNPRSDNNEALVRWETNALDVKTGMTFLRSQPGITKVLLYGFSGGGPRPASTRPSPRAAPATAMAPRSWCAVARNSRGCRAPTASSWWTATRGTPPARCAG